MQSKDLRIGNLVSYIEDNIIFTVTSIRQEMISAGNMNENCTLDIEAFEPIPLTEKWLVKFGFEKLMSKSENGYKNSAFSYRGKYSWIVYFDDGKLSLTFCQGNEKRYVHELQNLHFALTGEELELKNESKR